MIASYEKEKSRQDIDRDYELTASALDRWIKQFTQSGPFKDKDNRPPEEQEWVVLRNREIQLEMEVDILKLLA